MNILISWLISSVVIMIAGYILPGVHIDDLLTAVAVAFVLGILNALVKPILVVLTLPITIVTLGLFLLVINALLILLTDAIVPNFKVDGFWWAVLFSLLVSAFNMLTARLK